MRTESRPADDLTEHSLLRLDPKSASRWSVMLVLSLSLEAGRSSWPEEGPSEAPEMAPYVGLRNLESLAERGRCGHRFACGQVLARLVGKAVVDRLPPRSERVPLGLEVEMACPDGTDTGSGVNDEI